MVQRSPFGIRLWRLLSHRRPTFGTSIEYMVAALAELADVSRSDLGAVIDGAEPTLELVARLGPALGFHPADMFVIAGLSVPRDLASAWPTSPLNVGSIIRDALRMGARQLSRLNEVILSLSREPRTEPAPADDYPEGPGSLLVRLARNRNIRPYNVEEAPPWQARSPKVTSVRRPRMIGGMCAQVIKHGVSERRLGRSSRTWPPSCPGCVLAVQA